MLAIGVAVECTTESLSTGSMTFSQTRDLEDRALWVEDSPVAIKQFKFSCG